MPCILLARYYSHDGQPGMHPSRNYVGYVFHCLFESRAHSRRRGRNSNPKREGTRVRFCTPALHRICALQFANRLRDFAFPKLPHPGLSYGSLLELILPQPIPIHSRGFLFAPAVSETPTKLLGTHAQNHGKTRLRGLDPPGTSGNS